MTGERRYLPAASRDALLPIYDPIMTLLRFNAALIALVAQAELQPGFRVLDVGCGTGTLVVMLARDHPDLDIAGLDPDPRALARARRKAERAGVAVGFDRGFGDTMPYPDASFDRVFSSMMFHHVPRDETSAVLREVCRVLKPEGRLELLDFADDRLPARMRDCGFADARRLASRRTLAGAIAYYQAVRG